MKLWILDDSAAWSPMLAIVRAKTWEDARRMLKADGYHFEDRHLEEIDVRGDASVVAGVFVQAPDTNG